MIEREMLLARRLLSASLCYNLNLAFNQLLLMSSSVKIPRRGHHLEENHGDRDEAIRQR